MWDLNWRWCRPFVRSNLPRKECTVSFDRQTQPIDRNTFQHEHTSFDILPVSYCWKYPLRMVHPIAYSPLWRRLLGHHIVVRLQINNREPKQSQQQWDWISDTHRLDCTYHLDMYFPSNLNSDHLPVVLDAFDEWSGWASNCGDSNRNSPTDKQTKIHWGICPRNQTYWRQWSTTWNRIEWIDLVRSRSALPNKRTSLISVTGNFNFLRGCRSNT